MEYILLNNNFNKWMCFLKIYLYQFTDVNINLT